MLGRKIVAIGLFSLKKGRCRKQNLNVSFLKIHLCILVCFQNKINEIFIISAISDKKTSKHTFGKKCFPSENKKFYDVIHYIFQSETFFLPNVNLLLFVT